MGPIDDPVPSGTKERWMDVNGYQMRYLAGGFGPPLLLIHGLASSSFCWRRNLARLASRHAVYAPDLLGLGHPERTKRIGVRMEATARELGNFLKSMKISTIDILGSSHGAALAMFLAAESDGDLRVRRLVLAAPLNPWSRGNPWLIRLFSSAMGQWLAGQVESAPKALHRLAVKRLYGNGVQVTEATVRGYVEPLTAPGVGENIAEQLMDWDADLRRLKLLLPRIAHIPSLLIAGGRERAIALSSVEQLRWSFQHARFHVFPHAGHLLCEECAEEFNEVVLQFLDETGS